MKKKSAAVIMFLAVMILFGFAPVRVDAASTVANGTCGNDLTWVLDSNGKLTISGTGAMTNWDRQNFRENSVWGDYCKSITSIVVKKGVTTIGDYAFCSLNRLTDITIADSVTSIGDYAFGICSRLNTITLSNQLKKVGNYAFCGCKNLKKIVLPISLKYIGYKAFFNSKLSRVYYPGSKKKYSKINIEESNSRLTNAIVFYNSTGPANLSDAKITSVKNSSKGITLKWNKVLGASGYRICRVKTSSLSYGKIVSSEYIATCKGASKTSYTDTTAKEGYVYTYYVYPYKGKKAGYWTYTEPFFKVNSMKLKNVKNAASKKIKIVWKPISNVTGYEIYCSTSKKFDKNTFRKRVKGSDKKSYSFTKMKKGTTYYVKIRAYKNINGTKYYSTWSNVKKVKITK